MKETTLYSAAMTPGKHGPHKYPWSFARLQYPRTSANTTSGRQYYRYITVGDGNIYCSDAARNTAVILYHKLHFNKAQ